MGLRAIESIRVWGLSQGLDVSSLASAGCLRFEDADRQAMRLAPRSSDLILLEASLLELPLDPVARSDRLLAALRVASGRVRNDSATLTVDDGECLLLQDGMPETLSVAEMTERVHAFLHGVSLWKKLLRS